MLRLQAACVTGAWAGGRAGGSAKWAQGQKGDGPGQAEHVTQMDLADLERGAGLGPSRTCPQLMADGAAQGTPAKGFCFVG